MPQRSTSHLIWLALGVLAGGLLLPTLRAAIAQQPEPEPEAAAPMAVESPTPPRRMCRLFTVRAEAGWMADSADRTTELGQWLAEMEASGWELDELDFEVAQKPTDYPQGYLMACTRPVR